MIDSPSFLGDQVQPGSGVRRLNRRPLIIAGLILCLLLIAVSYTYQMRLAELRRRNQAASETAEPAGLPAILKDAPDGFIAPRQPAQPEPLPTQPADKPAALPAPEPDPYAAEWARYRQELERQRRAREQAAQKAIQAPTAVKAALPLRSKETPSAEPAPSAAGQLASLYTAEALRRRLDERQEEGERDLNRAAEKRAFLSDRLPESAAAQYLPRGREAPLSPYEIKAGTVIAATMVTGVNSDLPGQIIGQVAENVYDSASGRFVMIPQGAKLIGSYDNAITPGQERVLVAWQRIVLPDASSIDLGQMPGSDQSGLAGFTDKVDTHFWQMAGSAILLSVLSAGVQISQGGQSPGENGLNAQQSIAAGLGQQFGQLGAELARRNARQQPTLEIRPGYRFAVTVTKDMALRPWIEASTARRL